ncbi:MAG: Lrp/AsnC family transcriptional regulator [Rhizobacter sp.]|nr:Lrp/AsnC family transcriptional regulator [Rhizobacter sp.]
MGPLLNDRPVSPAATRLALLNDWQRDFPLTASPFAHIATALGTREEAVLHEFASLHGEGSVSRIGAVWGAGAGGAAMLCAFAVPAARLKAVAALVSAETGVNHNYEREHDWNLWFVVTGRDRAAVDATVDRLQACTGLKALRLRMQRAYRIDLGFELHRDAVPAVARAAAIRVEPVAAADRRLAALVEAGLPLVAQPYDVWAQALGQTRDALLATLARWQREGTVRRFGVIVRHHELGISHNAMTVFDVPDEVVDALGTALARERGITLCYRRERAAGWPYNLYCMVHGRDRGTVLGLVAQAITGAGLTAYDHAVLFSARRFKQQGARYFREDAREAAHAVA